MINWLLILLFKKMIDSLIIVANISTYMMYKLYDKFDNDLNI